MHTIFPYVSPKGGLHGLYRPQIEFHNEDTFTIGTARVERLRVEHGFPCCGYLMREKGSIGYVSDCHVLPEATIEKLKGVDVLILNCLREREHPTHLTVEAALGYIGEIGPKRAYLIHMCHDFTHEQWLKKLPKGVEPAYDGLELEI